MLKTAARLLLIGSLATFGLTSPVAAEPESPSRSFLVYVNQISQNVSLSPSEHLLVFGAAVQIPGANLRPGPYIFKLVAPSIVQVMNATRSTIYATFFTLTASGDGDTSRERIRFEENLEEGLSKIVGWYLPGDVGYEFVYPKPKRKPSERVIER